MRKRIGLWLLKPYLTREISHWNDLASVYVTPGKLYDAMSKRDQTVRISYGTESKAR
jgi:hypothetical protein